MEKEEISIGENSVTIVGIKHTPSFIKEEENLADLFNSFDCLVLETLPRTFVDKRILESNFLFTKHTCDLFDTYDAIRQVTISRKPDFYYIDPVPWHDADMDVKFLGNIKDFNSLNEILAEGKYLSLGLLLMKYARDITLYRTMRAAKGIEKVSSLDYQNVGAVYGEGHVSRDNPLHLHTIPHFLKNPEFRESSLSEYEEAGYGKGASKEMIGYRHQTVYETKKRWFGLKKEVETQDKFVVFRREIF